MPRRPDFYSDTNYKKVMFVIDKDVYAKMRSICDKDSKAVIKAGDLISIMMDLIDTHVPTGAAEASYEKHRDSVRKLSNRELMKAIPSLTAEQREAIEKIIGHK